MPANSLQQYIRSVYPYNYMDFNYLVSGVDRYIRYNIFSCIAASAASRNKNLLIIDNTHAEKDYIKCLDNQFNIFNVIDGKISLLNGFLEVDTIKGISKLRSLLSDLGFDSSKAMKIIAFLEFVKETETRLGNTNPLTMNILEEYGGTTLVKMKLQRLVDSGNLTPENMSYLLGRYFEVSADSADFESFFVMLKPFIGSIAPYAGMALIFPVGEFSDDKTMQNLLCKSLLNCLNDNYKNSAVMILDDGNNDRSGIIKALSLFPQEAEAHMLSNDVFNLEAQELNILNNRFTVKIYTRHADMKSCEKIETACGSIDVIKRSKMIAVDRRIRAYSPWDMLLGTNKIETDVAAAPVRDPKYRKEFIQSLPERTGIVDFNGEKTILTF